MTRLETIRRAALLALMFAVLPVGSALAGSTYDAVKDFSLSGNPDGTWSYGSLSAVSAGNFNRFTSTRTNVDYTGQQAWTNGTSYPNLAAVERNTSGSTAHYDSITLPTNLLRLDGQESIDDVRWTAPTSGVYSVTGYFQRIDSNSNYSVNVGVNLNGTSLFSHDNFYGGSATQASFNLSSLKLKAGDVIDFYEAAPQFNNDSTGLSAQIVSVSAVPEPSSFILLVISGTMLAPLAWRHRIEWARRCGTRSRPQSPKEADDASGTD